MRVERAVPTSALAIVAHPDDAEFQCGATLAAWAASGCVVHHLVLTDGSKGSWDPDDDLVALVATRQDEQRAAAKALGATGEVVFLGVVDGELQATLGQREEVARWIRRLTPEVVLGHDPWQRYRLHPDHRHAGWLAVDGVVAARDPHFYPHHEEPAHRPRALLLFEADEPDVAVDVTGFADRQVDALLAHRSQYRTTHFSGEELGGAGEPTPDQRRRFAQRIAAGLAAAGADAGVEQAQLYRHLDLA